GAARVCGGFIDESVEAPVARCQRHAADRAVLVDRLNDEACGGGGLLDGAPGARRSVGAEGCGALDLHLVRPRVCGVPSARRVGTYRLPFPPVARSKTSIVASFQAFGIAARFRRLRAS